MILKEQVYTQAALLAGHLEEDQEVMLDVLCSAATGALQARLREGLLPEDCRADFVAAASLFALAALNRLKEGETMEQITAGDLTVRKNAARDPASQVLRSQAELIIAPYLKDSFCFRGV